MILFRTWIPLIVLSLLLGCVKADRDKPSSDIEAAQHALLEENLVNHNNRALFEAGQIVLEDINFTFSGKDSWRQVDQIQMWFKVCQMRDRASQGTLRNEKFNISSELGSTIEWEKDGVSTKINNPVQVNSANCLRWSQRVPVFNYLAPSHNLVLHYKINSLAGQLGTIVKRFYFNPWDMYRNGSNSKAWGDLTDYQRSDWGQPPYIVGENAVVAALKGESADGRAQNLRLQMKNLNIVPSEQDMSYIEKFNDRLNDIPEKDRARFEEHRNMHLSETGIKMKINLQGMPFITLNNASGVQYTEDITSGRFKVFMTLFATNADPASSVKYRLAEQDIVYNELVNVTNEVRESSTNGLLASVPMVLRNDTEYGHVKMAIKIEPQDMTGVKPFVAVYDLGPHDQWMKRQTPQFDMDGFQVMDQVEDYDTLVNSTKVMDEELTTGREAKLFYFSPLIMRFVRIMPGETATDRTLQYSVRSCIEHGLYGTRVGRGLQFKITTHDRGKPHTMVRRTNQDGCVTWFGFLSHKYYRKEVLSEKRAEIEFISNKRMEVEDLEDPAREFEPLVNNFSKDFIYYMNPWDEKWTFGWDRPDMPKDYNKEIELLESTGPVSRLFIADFKYETMGFRYAIDDFLNLKVKKAILFKTYPFVLKYNSIVYGRRGTEPLRDGIYLMKVALQKDYLDPAAKGVLIYDKNVNEAIQVANEGPLLRDKSIDEVTEEEIRNFNLYQAQQIEFGEGAGVLTATSPSPEVKTLDGFSSEATDPESPQSMVTTEELRKAKKQYISVQQKLVRVMGGMIITPIEFEVEDLRLMRIRNQFFIQLQTIDEHKLRVATLLNEALEDIFRNWSLEERFKLVAEFLGDHGHIEYDESLGGDVRSQVEAFQEKLTKFEEQYQTYRAGTSLEEKSRSNLSESQIKLFESFGLSELQPGSDAYNRRFDEMRLKMARFFQYSRADLDSLASFRNEKRLIIGNILREYRDEMKDQQSLEAQLDELDELYKDRDTYDRDPMQEFMFMTAGQKGRTTEEVFARILREKIREAEANENKARLDVLRSLEMADFTGMPLTPSFDFNLIANDGEYIPNDPETVNASGLPSRTFVGPLTFVYNTNGSSVRPTDTLGESHCRTAFCEVADVVEGYDSSALGYDFETTYGRDESGGLVDDLVQPIYQSGESINKSYENNRYYGYLGDYADYTVDRLIEDKIVIDKKRRRDMEVGAELSHFVRKMRLKYTVLSDRPDEGSRLMDVEYLNCAENIENENYRDDCMSPVSQRADADKYLLSKRSLLEQINNRKYYDPNIEIPNYDKRISYVEGSDNAHFGENNRLFGNTEDYYYIDGMEIDETKLNKLLTHTEESESYDKHLVRIFQHRMCFVLTQNLLSRDYFKRQTNTEELSERDWMKRDRNLFDSVELECQKILGRYYGYRELEHTYGGVRVVQEDYRGSKYDNPSTSARFFSPIVIERKLRVSKTSGRYVYRGGKSLNINLQTSFSVGADNDFNTATNGYWQPYSWFKSLVGSIPIVGGISEAIAGGFSISRSNGRKQGVSEKNGTNVSSGTFLVNQQATFDIALSEFERCMVVKFHDSFTQRILSKYRRFMKSDFDDRTDFESLGVMICKGQKEKTCLPIKEKYFYFTQHFTEGDMLDTADLHNHPWLLQMRGLRDFQAFTATIGAQEVDYLEDNQWFKQLIGETWDDAKSLNMNGSGDDFEMPELSIVSQESDINWPLDELSKAYFNVTPTFPGLYTVFKYTPEWPYYNTDPGQASQLCEESEE